MTEELPADLDPSRLAASLGTRWLGQSGGGGIVALARCKSTNDVAANFAREGRSEGLVVVADDQTGGRGRFGRTWHSPPGTNLYVSILLRPPGRPWELPPITLMAGVVVARALKRVAATLAPRLKWPNDVLLPCSDGRRKVCGILTEMASDKDRVRHVVLGIGLNVNQDGFPDEIASRATSISMTLGRPVPRVDVLARLLEELEPAYEAMIAAGADAGRLVAEAWSQFGLLGERCRIERDGDRVEGVAEALEMDGSLRVRDADGRVQRIVSGELT